EEGLQKIGALPPDFALVDVRLGGMDGIEFVRRVRQMGVETVIIVMSAYGSFELAIGAIQAGAYDYVSKPFRQEEVLLALRKAEEREALRRENQALRAEMRARSQFEDIVGQSEAMRELFRIVEKAAAYPTTVLVTGESGTGKELVARALHRRSPRRDKPFVAVNCGAIPEALLESELFGHRRGAFTDARSDRAGLFEEADGGTLFLDEIGELSPQLQVKLLRVLQEGTIRRLGEVRERQVDVRVIAATARDLESEVEEGRFREDLFYRLNVLRIHVPPLRERRSDIPLLVEHFIRKHNARLHTQVKGVAPDVMKVFLAYPWPGNVRELENLLERMVILAEGEWITVGDLPEHLSKKAAPSWVNFDSSDLSIKRATRWIEETLIKKALEQTKGNRTQAARLLEISHRALLYKIKEYGLEKWGKA
ncbi:MAG: sigma-54 dependent transcriptional regulator, partial [Sandaracinaceae bacterium]|nr:sigma-54 dependent transcriptional regulator [Sandaracinaceae bacterium]